jgi:hypothetical protein
MKSSNLGAALGLAAAILAGGVRAAPAKDAAVPAYQHVFIIIEENKDYRLIQDASLAPNIARLAKTYGTATNFYAEVHPSEGNYVAMIGGDTFGIHDDDAFSCRPGSTDKILCPGADAAGYVDHTIDSPHLGDLLVAKGLSWKGYYESLPGPGSLAVFASDPKVEHGGTSAPVYASKHSGFLNFRSAQQDPDRARHIVGFDQLRTDLAQDDLPNFALIVPNQCNEMHGAPQPTLPPDCGRTGMGPLIQRGDAEIGRLVGELQKSRAWRSKENMAIVITFDEDSSRSREGCCGITPGEASNFGGGHIPTIVITNHGPRGVRDGTHYSHYSLLRTLQDAFGVRPYLRHAGDAGQGVRPMVKLFGVKGR